MLVCHHATARVPGCSDGRRPLTVATPQGCKRCWQFPTLARGVAGVKKSLAFKTECMKPGSRLLVGAPAQVRCPFQTVLLLIQPDPAGRPSAPGAHPRHGICQWASLSLSCASRSVVTRVADGAGGTAVQSVGPAMHA